jgi:hypothetical protein
MKTRGTILPSWFPGFGAQARPVVESLQQASVSFSSMGDLVKIKMKSEENKGNVLEAKLAIEREKLDLEKARVELGKAKGKVEMARMVLEMNGVDEVKGAANEFLITLFS